MVTEGKTRFDEPVRALLPAGTVAKPWVEKSCYSIWRRSTRVCRGCRATFTPADRANPLADYHREDLYAFLAKRGVAKPADASFLYSNLGLGLLGQALAERTEKSYSDLLQQEISGPLGLHDTVVLLSEEQQRRFHPGA